MRPTFFFSGFTADADWSKMVTMPKKLKLIDEFMNISADQFTDVSTIMQLILSPSDISKSWWSYCYYVP